MSSTTGSVIVFAALAAFLVIGFVGLWIRDMRRADEEAADPERAAPDPSAEHTRESFAQPPDDSHRLN